MGKLLVLLKYVFLVFSADIKEKRKHVHVRDSKSGLTNLCKFWVEPKVEIEYNYGFTKKELNEIEKLIVQNKNILLKQLHLFYDGKQVKAIRKTK
jgi:hypothetical protein